MPIWNAINSKKTAHMMSFHSSESIFLALTEKNDIMSQGKISYQISPKMTNLQQLSAAFQKLAYFVVIIDHISKNSKGLSLASEGLAM